MTPSSETEFFWGWFRWESCSPGYSGHLFILGQALPAHLVGGYGARAVSRKTPIYFMNLS